MASKDDNTFIYACHEYWRKMCDEMGRKEDEAIMRDGREVMNDAPDWEKEDFTPDPNYDLNDRDGLEFKERTVSDLRNVVVECHRFLTALEIVKVVIEELSDTSF